MFFPLPCSCPPERLTNAASISFSNPHSYTSISFDQIGGFLADAVGGHLGVAAVQLGHDANVGDAKVARAAHAELSVDDSEGVVRVAHGAGAGGMVAWRDGISGIRLPTRTGLKRRKGDEYM